MRGVVGRGHDGGARGGHVVVVAVCVGEADHPHHIVDLFLRVCDPRQSQLKQLSRLPQFCELSTVECHLSCVLPGVLSRRLVVVSLFFLVFVLLSLSFLSAQKKELCFALLAGGFFLFSFRELDQCVGVCCR